MVDSFDFPQFLQIELGFDVGNFPALRGVIKA
jgi:hypothetical protein